MKSTFLRSLFILLYLLINYNISTASHLLGGEMSYTCLGGGKYAVTLTIFRDANAAATLDDPAVLTIFDNDNNAIFSTYSVGLSTQSIIPNNPDPCIQNFPSSIQIEKGVYLKTITLPNNTNGYKIVYQRCCRNNSVTNVIDDIGSTYVLDIPANAICNSSPVFNNRPPLFLCANSKIKLDMSATDQNGDVLKYSLCAPYLGADVSNPIPTTASYPPYNNVIYNSGYSSTKPLGAGSTLAIDPNTGLMTGEPRTLGLFVVGICVEEFRGGVSLSKTIRDFQFNIYDCSSISAIPSVVVNNANAVYQTSPTSYTSCNGLTVQFSSEDSIHSNFWNFGDPAKTNDTSVLRNPSYTFTDTGTYNVTLYVDRGKTCGDSSTIKVTVYKELKGNFLVNPTCLNNAVVFTDSSTSFYNDIVGWKWYFGDGDSLTTQQAQHHYATDGTYTANLIANTQKGCKVKATRTVTVFPVPNADFSLKKVCYHRNALFTNNSSISSGNIPKYYWDFGNGNKDSVSINPSSLYSSDNTYPIQLIAVSDKGCRDTTLKSIMIADTLKPNFTFPATNCQNNAVVFSNTSIGVYSGFVWSFRDSLNTTSTTTSPTFNYTKAGTYPVKLTTNHSVCGQDSIIKNITITSLPLVSLPLNSSLCNGNKTTLSVAAIYDSVRWNTNETTNSIQIDGTKTPINIVVYKNGCSNTASSNILLKPKPIADFYTDKICSNKPTSFLNNSTVTTPDSITNYQWNINSNAFISTLKNPVFNLNQSTIYTTKLIVTSNSNCTDTLIKTLTLSDTFIPKIIVPTTACLKDIIPFIDSSKGENINYTWQFGDNQTSSSKNTTHSYSTATTFLVKLIIQNKNCGVDSISKNITLKPLPSIGLQDNIVMCPGEAKTLFASGVFDSIFWSNGTTVNPTEIDGNEPKIIFTGYQLGCKNVDSVLVIPNCDVFIPTAFSPNNDGINDYFNIMSLNVISYTLSVFNRWGELVFTTNSMSKSWDGFYKGQRCDEDNYVYYATGIKKDNKPFVLKGIVTLLK